MPACSIKSALLRNPEPIVSIEDLRSSEQLPSQHQQKLVMPNALTLEGLEEYEIPQNGDVRKVESIDAEFVYFDVIHGWVRIFL